MTPVRLLLVDDQPSFRRSLSKLLAKYPDDVEVVGQAANAAEALQCVAALQPDVVLMDVEMPNMNGVVATERICAAHPHCKVILLTTFDTNAYIFGSLRAGATSYILKDVSPEVLIESIYAAAHGEALFQPVIATKLVHEFKRLTPPLAQPHASGEVLSRREHEILALVACGQSNNEIADALILAEGTVKNHISNILSKLRAGNRAHAVRRAQELGLI
jgi:DNA-binding NarL/FixJ family response regulator